MLSTLSIAQVVWVSKVIWGQSKAYRKSLDGLGYAMLGGVKPSLCGALKRLAAPSASLRGKAQPDSADNGKSADSSG